MRLSARRLRWLLNIWPPFLCSGIRVLAIADDYGQAAVRLRKHWYNRNAVGVHFGGSLFAMTDPFWMLLLMNRLGAGYTVWDKAAEIDFVAPGRSDVHAHFVLDETVVDAIRTATADGGRYLHWFETEVVADDGEVIARVRKQVYVRRRSAGRSG